MTKTEKGWKLCSFWMLSLVVLDYIDSGLTQTSAPFLCQSSSDVSGQVYTPNIPDFYFNDINAADFRTGSGVNLTDSASRYTTYFFTIPIESAVRNCSGTAVSIQYCYRARNDHIDRTRNVFILLSVNRNGLQFTINSKTTIQTTPRNSICTNPPGNIQQICCDTTTLSGFQIPSSEYTFGIVITTNVNRPLAFANSVMEYRVEQFRAALGNTGPSQGSTVTLTEGDRLTDRSLLLMKFIIDQPEVVITEPPTPKVTTESITTRTPILSTSTISSHQETTESITSEATRDSSTEPNPLTTDPVSSSGGVNDVIVNPSSSRSSATLGGAIGGCVVLLVIMAVIVCIVVILVKGYKSKQQLETEEANPMGYENAIYGTEKGNTYAGVGPQVHTKENSLGKNKEVHDYFYAESGASYEVPSSICTPDTDYNTKGITSPFKDEDIYMVPENDETLLYAQLENIKIEDIFRDSVKLSGFLGSGQFGNVYKGVLEFGRDEVEVAVKTLKEGSGEEDRVKFLQEAAIMGQFRHPNVVKMFGVITDGEPILLVLELLKRGDLRDYLVHIRLEAGVSIDPHTLLSYCRQVASGMVYLSNKAFVHRDLAARNILVSENEICKIADFGMSRDLMEESYYVSHGGKIPVKWTAPEALYYKKYSSASDVWSFGTLMYEIWSVGHKPYENYSNSEVIKLIDTGYRLPPPPGCPRAIYNIMIMCWHPVSSQRLSFAEINQKLSLADPKLLKWSSEDKCIHPEATKLGSDLLCGQELFKDLQTSYMAGN